MPKSESEPGNTSAVKTRRPLSRRRFLSWWGIGWTLFATAIGSCVAAVGRFMMPNVLFEPPLSFLAGFPEEYAVGRVDSRFKEKFGVFIVREAEGFYALSTVCTHLGCAVQWQAPDQKFKCPCHGSGFYKSGVHFEGPAPRPLERHKITLAEDGQLRVDKSYKYLREKGEWNEPEAFLPYTGSA